MSIPGVTVHFHTLVLRLSTTCLSWGPQLGMVTTVAWQWPLLAPWGLLGGDRGATAGPQSHRGVPSPATAAPPTPNLGHGGASSRAPAMGWGDKISPAPGTGATGLAGPKWSRGVAVAETCSKLCVKLLACPSLLPLWKELFLGICQQGVLCPSRRVQDHHPPPPSVGVHPGAPRSCCPKGFWGVWECVVRALGRSGRATAHSPGSVPSVPACQGVGSGLFLGNARPCREQLLPR